VFQSQKRGKAGRSVAQSKYGKPEKPIAKGPFSNLLLKACQKKQEISAPAGQDGDDFDPVRGWRRIKISC
jgi:hypothetical protein